MSNMMVDYYEITIRNEVDEVVKLELFNFENRTNSAIVYGLEYNSKFAH